MEKPTNQTEEMKQRGASTHNYKKSLAHDFDKPATMLHSQMLIFALGFARKHSDFNLYSFFMLWNPENLLR